MGASRGTQVVAASTTIVQGPLETEVVASADLQRESELLRSSECTVICATRPQQERMSLVVVVLRPHPGDCCTDKLSFRDVESFDTAMGLGLGHGSLARLR